MARKTRNFTHRDKFSGYMQVVADALGEGQGRTLLDVPAGAGHFGDALAQRDFVVTHADFNNDRPDFVAVDMNKTFDFKDARFDVVTCLEGIEHVISDAHVIGELARITRPGGTVVISTPNIAHICSRMRFLSGGCFFQFSPLTMHDAANNEPIDRGHIMPIYLPRLVYLARQSGLQLHDIQTDRLKCKWLYPIDRLIALASIRSRRSLFQPDSGCRLTDAQRQHYHRLMYSPSVTMGRTLITFFQKAPADGATAV